ncbi:hypothetical protein CVD25_19685 [Bacillus canaveralius]|uniref:HD-GYP domain-containing protein n=1 Tax=Bacillus canaveralius TaxID=1403243 RepID=A0A2N5GIR5_9BACI|nr:MULTISPECIES: HD-GYP domain-containing protein [Bacillus]PLR80921.1 hypothetical protein CU635_16800 [Bacillus canaveralius]PLR81683.1 hypothetical protein CVD23_18060 [Bacillus sp. V33-4]PLR91209.1 hypothetical protein CVD25_19685 [Bacillus canaveralius]RSK52673.1 HD domain-containing protein [Bacillus canaveralius]
MGIINEKSFIETVHMKGLQISLIASGDGTEVIYHKLENGTRWGLEPAEQWEALEYIYVLSGELHLLDPEEETFLKPGDSFFKNPVAVTYFFQANGPTEFLYITSQPIYHLYSKATKELLELAVSIEEKDGYTVGHCERIKKLSMLVGETIGLKTNQLKCLNIAAFLHDVGKLRIPLDILQKPGKLTPEEWNIMKEHSLHGRKILEEIGLPFLKEAGKIVEQHHERYDGSGYPHGLKGDEISIEAAIIAVVDSYDAMTTERVYQKARTKEAALNELYQNRGTLYNPYIVDTFLELQKDEF